jgi:hypothetical protein
MCAAHKNYAFDQTEIAEWRGVRVHVQHTASVYVNVTYYSVL